MAVERKYPVTMEEFEHDFPTEESCRDYLFSLRWSEGFVCPKCGNSRSWQVRTVLLECTKCHHQVSVIAGTIFQSTRKPLTMWFRAIWHVTSQKHGASALGLQRYLGLGSYQTAWTWLHKLRVAMVNPERDLLKGFVEVDEIDVRGMKAGRGRLGFEDRILMAVAVEIKDDRVFRIRLATLDGVSSSNLLGFVQDGVEKGSTVRTYGRDGYKGLESLGYCHEVYSIDGQELLPNVRFIMSNLRRYISGTHQGSVSGEHFGYCLDEFAFRFNNRPTSPGKLFFQMLNNAVCIKPPTYSNLVEGSKRIQSGQMSSLD